MRTIDKIITPVNCQYGAPMGRASKFPKRYLILGSGNMRKTLANQDTQTVHKLFDCRVPMRQTVVTIKVVRTGGMGPNYV